MAEIGVDESKKMLKYIFLLFGLSAVVLTIILATSYLVYLISPQKPFYILFGNELTFTNEGKSTWLIDNREDNSEKLLRIYWADKNGGGNVSQIVIRSSELADSSGKRIDANNIKFNGKPVYIAEFTRGWNGINVTLNDSSLPQGSFEGRILVSGNTVDSIPMTISTKPLLVYAITLVVIGALVSVCLWEIIRYYKIKAKNKHHTRVEGLLGPLNINADNFNASLVREQITANTIELNKQLTRNSNPTVTIPKIAIIELLSSLLGIAVALFGVLYNENVTSVQVLGWYEVLALIGIGLASGSLKELVEKD